MTIPLSHTVEIIEAMENFISKIMPPEDIRPELDFIYKIEGQSILIYEVRPHGGYNGSNSATYFGLTVPGISVQRVPLF